MGRIYAKDISIIAIGSALVFLATASIQVYIPATKGYFNIGEVMVYTIALLFGPYVGAVCGGVGSALADLATGYGIFAPATLVIKGIEGFIVGYLSRKVVKIAERRYLFTLSLMIALIFLMTFILFGSIAYFGGFHELTALRTFSITLSIPKVTPSIEVYLSLSVLIWMIIGIVAFIALFMLIKRDPVTGLLIPILMIGGLEMIIGYFLYETVLYGYAAALIEIPWNIGQMIIGMTLAPILARIIEEAVPSIKRNKY